MSEEKSAIQQAIEQLTNGGNDKPYWKYIDEVTIGVFVADEQLMCSIPAVEKEIAESFAKMLCDLGDVLKHAEAEQKGLAKENEQQSADYAALQSDYNGCRKLERQYCKKIAELRMIMATEINHCISLHRNFLDRGITIDSFKAIAETLQSALDLPKADAGKE